MSTTETGRSPGRPRQPYCLDCMRAGRPNVPKKPGYGYCEEDVQRRQRAYRRASQEAIDITEAREKNYRDEIDTLKAEVAASREEIETLRRKTVNPLDMVPEELEAEHERALRKEMVKYKALCRGLLYDIFESGMMPEKYNRDDPKWDF